MVTWSQLSRNRGYVPFPLVPCLTTHFDLPRFIRLIWTPLLFKLMIYDGSFTSYFCTTAGRRWKCVVMFYEFIAWEQFRPIPRCSERSLCLIKSEEIQSRLGLLNRKIIAFLLSFFLHCTSAQVSVLSLKRSWYLTELHYFGIVKSFLLPSFL